LDKPFRVRPAKEVLENIEMARSYIPHTRRVFLADGNALVLSTQRLVPILDALGKAFPNLERVGIYANAQDIHHCCGTGCARVRRNWLLSTVRSWA